MRRADRLLQLVQQLRRRTRPVTAAALADALDVGVRTVYRDVAALQANGVPIEGEAGVGYVLKAGYDLPPLMFNVEEVEALMLGARMVVERGDPQLARAAHDVIAKVRSVLPKALADELWRTTLLVPHRLEEGVGFGEHVVRVRHAVRENRKLRIRYGDASGAPSERVIWPLGLYLFSHVTFVCAWCELRGGYRAFRSDRIDTCEPLDARFDPRGGALLREFLVGFAEYGAAAASPAAASG